MAQRRAPVKQRAPSAVPTEDLDFLASQQSSGSDDQAIQVAIAHQLMRRITAKSTRKDFSKNKLAAEISAATDDVRSTVETTEKAYAKFILDYATLEDTIHALWMEIKKAEQTLIEIAKKQHAANDAIRTMMETTGYAALGQIKESCHAGRQVDDTLMPPAV